MTAKTGRITTVGAVFLAASISLAPQSSAQPAWEIYVDPTFGTTIFYPAHLFTESAPNPNGIVLSGGGVSLEVSAISLPEIQSISDLRMFLAGAEGYENVTYSPHGERWLVISGYRGPNVFYEKFFIGRGIVQAFSLEYPIEHRQRYDPLVEIIEDSFRRGQ